MHVVVWCGRRFSGKNLDYTTKGDTVLTSPFSGPNYGSCCSACIASLAEPEVSGQDAAFVAGGCEFAAAFRQVGSTRQKRSALLVLVSGAQHKVA